MEIGRRCREMKAMDLILNDINADEYLKKARILFEEIGFQQDLYQLDKIIDG